MGVGERLGMDVVLQSGLQKPWVVTPRSVYASTGLCSDWVYYCLIGSSGVGFPFAQDGSVSKGMIVPGVFTGVTASLFLTVWGQRGGLVRTASNHMRK